MGHHSHESNDKNNDPQFLGSVSNSSHPFLEKNDLTYLSMLKPLLSPNGQKILSFFISFSDKETLNNSQLDLATLIAQISPRLENSPLKDLLPTLLSAANSSESKGALNPALLSTLLSTISNKKEE